MPEPIGIVGAGSVGRAIGRLLYADGQPVVAIASRTLSSAESAAAFIGANVRPLTCARLATEVRRVLIATSDRAVTPVAEELAASGFTSGLALHTCGALGPDALAPLAQSGVSCGVLHPFQTIRSAEQGVDSLRSATFAVSGDVAAIAWARDIVDRIGGRAVLIDPARMPVYHAAAVMAGNGVTVLVDAAVALLHCAGLDDDAALAAIVPLSRTTLENAVQVGPVRSLTGPIARGDAATVRAHVQALAESAPELMALYDAVGFRLLDLARRRGLPDERVDAIKDVLDACRAGGSHGK